jgi:hypothetical protein
MTASSRVSIAGLPKGHEFVPVSFSVSGTQVRAYLDAVGDGGDYGDVVPPLAIVALALQTLQHQLTLPDGSLHTGQEVEHLGAADAGEPFTLTGRIALRSERQGFVATAIDYEIATAARVVVKARTTIMAPGGDA